MYHTILFDLDGTLTDSKPGLLRCLQETFRELGRPVPGEDTLSRFIGPPLQNSFASQGMDQGQVRQAMEVFRRHYGDGGMYEAAAAPGMRELCARLGDRGVVLALASSKPESQCRPICEHYGYAPFFREIVGSPDGADWDKETVIRAALKRLQVPEKDWSGVLMVGDRKYDAEGAKACGIDCAGAEFFGYAEPGELEQAGAKVIVHSAEELERFLTEEN